VRRVDAIVVGGGVMGAAAAWALAQQGRETILYEQFELGHVRGSSHGPSRVFRLAYPQPEYVRLARAALESWRRLEDAAGEALLLTTGGLYTGEWAEACGAALASCGVARAWLPAAEAAERFPAMSFEGVERVLWQEDGGICLAERAIDALLRLAGAGGVEVREREEVEHVLLDDQGIMVATPSERVTAPVVVVAAGTWAGGLLSQLAIELPLRPAFTQVSYFEPRPGQTTSALPTYVESDLEDVGLGRGGYWIPPHGEDARIKVGAGVPGRTVDPAMGPFDRDVERLERDVGFVAQRLPAFSAEPVATETCLYTMTPDGDFVLERVGPVVICSCCSGHGFKFAPRIGELVAALATGASQHVTSERFSLARFALEARQTS
jgi:sarcosine oxidase